MDVFSRFEQHCVGTKIALKKPKAKKAEMLNLRLYEKLCNVILINILWCCPRYPHKIATKSIHYQLKTVVTLLSVDNTPYMACPQFLQENLVSSLLWFFKSLNPPTNKGGWGGGALHYQQTNYINSNNNCTHWW